MKRSYSATPRRLRLGAALALFVFLTVLSIETATAFAAEPVSLDLIPVSTDNAGTVYLPSAWLLTSHDEPPRVLRFLTNTAWMQTSLQLFPDGLQESPQTVFGTASAWLDFPEGKEINLFAPQNLEILARGTLENMGILAPDIWNVTSEEIWINGQSVTLATYETLIPSIRVKTALLHHGNKAVYPYMAYPPDSEDEWDPLFRNILARWQVETPQAPPQPQESPKIETPTPVEDKREVPLEDTEEPVPVPVFLKAMLPSVILFAIVAATLVGMRRRERGTPQNEATASTLASAPKPPVGPREALPTARAIIPPWEEEQQENK